MTRKTKATVLELTPARERPSRDEIARAPISIFTKRRATLRPKPEEQDLRLTEILTRNFPLLCRYLGPSKFQALAGECGRIDREELVDDAAVCRRLTVILGRQAYARQPELAEIAAFETLLKEAGATPSHGFIGLCNLASAEAADLGNARLGISPSARRFHVDTNVTSLIACLSCDEAPPPPRWLGFRQQMLVWRQGPSARFRILGDEEAMALDSALAGRGLAEICRLVGERECPETAEARTMIYLRGWAEAQIIESITPSLRSAGSSPGRAA